MAEQVRECEVVVVGAGYSGLAAARRLARAGVDTLVLDARPRVGGRSFTEVSGAGFTIDRGGQWMGPTQDHLAALAAELGVATFPTWTEGQGVELRDGDRHTYVGLVPTSDPEGAADGIACMLDLDLASFDVPLDAPWNAADAAALDAQTLATYFDTHLTSASARAILEVAVKAIFGTGPGELSLLFALFYLHSGGGLTNLARTTGGAQERRFAGGSQQLAEGMAAELGERVLLGAPVEEVAYGPGYVTVTARPAPPVDVVHVRARRAIFAMAPALCGRLDYSPPLPGNRDQLCQRMPMGAVTKVHVIYEEPFWRADGLNGQIVAPGSVLESAFDNSPDDASHGAIVGFVAGDDCRR
ncbi:MAG: FAD-dependent oxidoreductase, partial [Acidimicrobiales bacterium]